MEKDDSFGHTKKHSILDNNRNPEEQSLKKIYNSKGDGPQAILKNLKGNVSKALFNNTTGPQETQNYFIRCSPRNSYGGVGANNKLNIK